MDPPPPYSRTPEVPGSSRRPQSLTLRWHPKMTPFRLFVLLAIVVLGTMKAVFTYRGESSMSTTLEWIAGVIFTLLIFVLGEWESKGNYPEHFRWFFTSDCTDLIWIATRAFSLPRPLYRSDESNALSVTSTSTSVPITGYRILVSTVVITLGTVKATLTHLGYNTSANTVDWTLGVLVTSILYYIGLYESNTVNLAPNFFSRNHSSPVFRIVRDVVITIALTLAMYISIKWVQFSLDATKNAYGAFAITIVSKPSSFILLHSLNVYVLSATFLSLASSLFCSVAILALAVFALHKEYPLIAGYIVRRPMFSQFYDRVARSLSNATYPLQLRHAGRIGMLFIRTFLHLFGLVIIASLILLFTGVLMVLNEQNNTEKGITWGLIRNLAIQLTVVAYGLVFLVILYTLLRSFIAPFLSFNRTEPLDTRP